MEKLEIELVTLSNLYPNDSVLGMEVRKIADRIRLENVKEESPKMVDPETFEPMTQEEYKNKYKK